MIVAYVSFPVIAAAVWVALDAARKGERAAYITAKAIGSAAFLAAAVASGALAATWSAIALGALVLAAAGDVALAVPGRSALLGGLVAFALAYLVLAAAFTLRGLGNWLGIAVGGVVAVLATASDWRWLRPHLSGGWRLPAAIYHVAAGVMIAAGIASGLRASSFLAVAGVLLVAGSDVAVARERFVTAGVTNKEWGLPAYYAGMYLIALSLAG